MTDPTRCDDPITRRFEALRADLSGRRGPVAVAQLALRGRQRQRRRRVQIVALAVVLAAGTAGTLSQVAAGDTAQPAATATGWSSPPPASGPKSPATHTSNAPPPPPEPTVDLRQGVPPARAGEVKVTQDQATQWLHAAGNSPAAPQVVPRLAVLTTANSDYFPDLSARLVWYIAGAGHTERCAEDTGSDATPSYIWAVNAQGFGDGVFYQSASVRCGRHQPARIEPLYKLWSEPYTVLGHTATAVTIRTHRPACATSGELRDASRWVGPHRYAVLYPVPYGTPDCEYSVRSQVYDAVIPLGASPAATLDAGGSLLPAPTGWVRIAAGDVVPTTNSGF